MNWGRGTWSYSDSVAIRPSFLPIKAQTNQNDDSYSEMGAPCQSSIQNTDDSALDVDIKEEVGELFMGRSIDVENEETIFPTGLILIHDQPALTATTPESQTETHLLTYTPVYMDEKESPSYLQISTPKSSIIRTNHSQNQYVQQVILPTPSEGTRLLARFHGSRNSTPKDPLEISPPNVGNDIESNRETIDTVYKEKMCHSCNLCNKRFATLLGLANHKVGVHRTGEIIVNRNAEARKLSLRIEVPTKKVSEDPLDISPQSNHQVQTKPAINITIKKDFQCTLCEMKFRTFVKRNNHVLKVHERILCSHTSQEQCKLAFCNVYAYIPTHQHIIEVQKKRKVSSSNNEELTGMDQEPIDPLGISVTKPNEIVPGRVECTSKEILRETLPGDEKRYKCTSCELNFVDNNERDFHEFTVHINKHMEVKLRDELRLRQKAESARRRRELQRQNETPEPEQRKARLAIDAERSRKRFANETPERRKERLEANAERNRKYLANETPEQRNARLAADTERHRNSLTQEIPGQRVVRFATDSEQQKKYFAVERPDQRSARLTLYAERNRNYLANETPEKRAKRLAAMAERARKRSANETPKQKKARRARQAERMRNHMADETLEESTTMLAVEDGRDLDFVQCKYCEKSLAPRSLKEHIHRHHARVEDRIFKCEHCEKTFALEIHQKTHSLTHSMEKRFICDKCGKGYKVKSGLTNHIIFKHRYDEDVQEKYWQE